MEALLPFAAITVIGVILYQLFALVGDMATDRGHDPWVWWIISLVWSPVGSIIVMWVFFPIEDDES